MQVKNFTITLIYVVILNACTQKKEIKHEYFGNGAVKWKAEYIGDLRNGIMYEYIENGEVKSISNWKEDKLNGVVKHFYENGNIKSEGLFKNHHRVGEFTFYNEQGIKIETQEFDDKGNLNDFLLYDSLGNNIRNPRLSTPFINVEEERISFGERFNIEIGLGNRFADSVVVIIGKLNEEDSLLQAGDTLANNNYFFTHSFMPQIPGPQFFYYKMIQIANTDTTIHVTEIVEKFTFNVDNGK